MTDIEIHFKDGRKKLFSPDAEVRFNKYEVGVEYEGFWTFFPVKDVESVVVPPTNLDVWVKNNKYYVGDSVSEQARLAAEFLNSK